MTNYGTHVEHAALVLPLAGLVHWNANPRHENDSEVEALKESLGAVGQLDDLHVWRCLEGDKVLRGNRRLMAMRELGWVEARQIVHEFSDERDAYRFLLEDHAPGRVVALTAEEKIVSVENGVKMGMTVDELAPSLGGNVKLTQMYWDLGKGLPMKAREALGDGRMMLTTAAMLLKIADAKQREEASRQVLQYDGEGEPMPYKQARALIETNWILPAKHETDWMALCVTLKKKFSVIEGHVYVSWKDKDDFVMGWRGNPEPGYEFGDVPMPGEPDGRTWESVARELQVPVYLCPAPDAKTGFVRLVNTKMIKQALNADQKKKEGDPQITPIGGRIDEPDFSESESEIGLASAKSADEPAGMSEEERRWLRVTLNAIYEALLATPTDAMGEGPWEPLMSYLAELVAGGAAFDAWGWGTTLEDVHVWASEDTKLRWYLRQPIMMLLCAQYDAAVAPVDGRAKIAEVAAALGVEVGNVKDQPTNHAE